MYSFHERNFFFFIRDCICMRINCEINWYIVFRITRVSNPLARPFISSGIQSRWSWISIWSPKSSLLSVLFECVFPLQPSPIRAWTPTKSLFDLNSLTLWTEWKRYMWLWRILPAFVNPLIFSNSNSNSKISNARYDERDAPWMTNILRFDVRLIPIRIIIRQTNWMIPN